VSTELYFVVGVTTLLLRPSPMTTWRTESLWAQHFVVGGDDPVWATLWVIGEAPAKIGGGVPLTKIILLDNIVKHQQELLRHTKSVKRYVHQKVVSTGYPTLCMSDTNCRLQWGVELGPPQFSRWPSVIPFAISRSDVDTLQVPDGKFPVKSVWIHYD